MRKSYIRSQKAKNHMSRRARGATAATRNDVAKRLFGTDCRTALSVSRVSSGKNNVPTQAAEKWGHGPIAADLLQDAESPTGTTCPDAETLSKPLRLDEIGDVTSAHLRNKGNGRGAEDGDEGPLFGLTVEQIATDEGAHAYLFTKDGVQVAVMADQLLMAKSVAMQQVQQQLGVNLVTPRTKRDFDSLIDAAKRRDDIIAVTRVGFDRRQGHEQMPKYYAYGDGNIYSTKQAPKCVVCFAPQSTFGSRGDRRVHEKIVASVIRDQAAPIFMFFAALSPIIQRYTKHTRLMVENAIVEMCGRSTSNKSSFTTLLGGSLWGGHPLAKLGYAHSWNATANKLEEFCSLYNNSLLILDEATTAGADPKSRGETILNVLHRVSLGETRGRKGEGSEIFELMVLSNSNQSLRSILRETAEVEEASDVRLIAVGCPTRESGYFDTMPDKYPSIEAAMNALRQSCTENYGHIARRLIRAVLKWSETDHQGLIDAIQSYMHAFLQRAGIDSDTSSSIALRRAKVFALADATARIAFKTGVLDKALWGATGKSLRKAWRKYGRQGASTASGDHFATFLADTKSRLVDVTKGGKPKIPNDQFAKVDGFIYRLKAGDFYLLMSPAKMKARLALSAARLKALKERKLLKGNDGLRMKVRVRFDDDGKLQREPFYAFRIEAVPQHARPYGEAGAKEGD
ncbi:DUF927 domain-containing protein [Ensifer aridi]|uniref:DUF927 domain-containing protein n=1 Tax=Ensifer aridi TaxID=1708715 RepID=UPI00359011C6